jgi:hypothetical protein
VERNIGSSQHEEQRRVNDDAIITFRLDPDAPPATDWSRFDVMTEAEQEAAAR